MLFDELLRRAGQFGPFQLSLYCLLGLVGIPTGWQNLLMVFLAPDVDHWCRVDELSNLSMDLQKNLSIPYDYNKQKFSQCLMYDLNYSRLLELGSLGHQSLNLTQGYAVKKCSSWNYDRSVFQETIVSKMNLVCDYQGYVSYLQTVYMAGFLTGCLTFGQISDRIGRFKALVISLFGETVFALAATFTPVYIGFMIVRFFVGICAAGAYTTAFVMIMEIIGPKYRMFAGINVQCWFALGFMSLPGIAYALPHHVKLQLVTAIGTGVIFLIALFVPESPRWLIIEGRHSKARKIISHMVRCNRTHDRVGSLSNINLSIKEKLLPETQEEKTEIKGNFLDMFRTRNLRRTTAIMWFSWLVTSAVYYGMSMGAGSLLGNLFLNTFINASSEVPACILTALVLDLTGRRWFSVATFLLAAVCSVAMSALLSSPDHWLAVLVLSIVIKFVISANFAVVYVYAAELFPTVIRNVGVGSSSMMARLGALIQPQLMRLSSIWVPIPMLVFGGASAIAAILCVFLPETARKVLPETLEEGESFNRLTKMCEPPPFCKKESRQTEKDINFRSIKS